MTFCTCLANPQARKSLEKSLPRPILRSSDSRQATCRRHGFAMCRGPRIGNKSVCRLAETLQFRESGENMWIIKVALNRPYTFIVLALLILIVAPVVIFRTPTDIFPNINIPVVSVAWTYTGLNPEELEGRLTTPYEKALSLLVDNIEHLESTTYNGVVVVKLFLQPNTSLDTANAQVTAASQFLIRSLPPGTQAPQIIDFSASSVPILQLGLSGPGF